MNSPKLVSRILHRSASVLFAGLRFRLSGAMHLTRDVVVLDKDARACMRSQESCTTEKPHQEQISAEIVPFINRAFATKIATIKALRDSFGPRCRADLIRL